MIAKAVADNSDDKIKYEVCSVEEYIYPENTYDLVISNLVLHYIENLANIYQKVYCTLTQILNPLIKCGFQIEAIEEAMPPADMMDMPVSFCRSH